MKKSPKPSSSNRLLSLRKSPWPKLRPKPPPNRPRNVPEPAARPAGAAEAVRLQKLLAGAGLGSRREIESWIEAGRIGIAGRVAKLGDRAAPSDEITLDGKPLRIARPSAGTSHPRVLIYHKPVGELVTRDDPGGRVTVFSRLPPGRWVAVGRLDINSAGLLLFTDSGDLANRLMHPRYEVEREYAARVQGRLSAEALEKLRRGVQLDDGMARFSSIQEAPGRENAGANRWYRVSLHEGRNREVRRLFEAVGGRVSRLIRVRYGAVRLPADLDPGHWRELDSATVQGLFGS